MPSRGQKHSEEAKKKIGAAHKGRKLSHEVIERRQKTLLKEYNLTLFTRWPLTLGKGHHSFSHYLLLKEILMFI